VTKVHDDGEGSGSAKAHAAVGSGSDEAAEIPDAKPGQVVGGNGSPAFRDPQGHVHGPGGPIFMGHGVDCDAAHDHCMRPEVWFSVGNIVPGKLYRALPVFTFEDKWWTWRGQEDSPIKLYRTKLAGKDPVPANTPIVFFSAETSSTKWLDSEYEALTSSRWEAGVTESASVGGPTGAVKVKGWGDVQTDTVRVIVEARDP
jgi:hypothetical protein